MIVIIRKEGGRRDGGAGTGTDLTGGGRDTCEWVSVGVRREVALGVATSPSECCAAARTVLDCCSCSLLHDHDPDAAIDWRRRRIHSSVAQADQRTNRCTAVPQSDVAGLVSVP